MHSLFTKKEDIIAWLVEQEIYNYSLVESKEFSWVVDCVGSVELEAMQLKRIPIKFNQINGNFSITNNALVSLYGCPNIVDGAFNCSQNKLKSLKWGPVGGMSSYFCDLNELIDLEGCAQEIGSHFMCSDNFLTSLKGGPRIVGHNYFATENDLQTLEYFPEKVGLGMFCSGNPKLGFGINDNNFKELYEVHLIHKTAAMEKKLLEDSININKDFIDKNQYKI